MEFYLNPQPICKSPLQRHKIQTGSVTVIVSDCKMSELSWRDNILDRCICDGNHSI